MKKLTTFIIFVIVVVAGYYLFIRTNKTEGDYLNTTYNVAGQDFTLVAGYAEKDIAPGSATKNTLSVFGEPVFGDVNGDGVDDAALILVNDSGGSGTFYYLAVAIRNPNDGYDGSNAILMGDRVAPQNVEIKDRTVIANYADRLPDEPMTAKPSLGVSLYAVYKDGIFQEK